MMSMTCTTVFMYNQKLFVTFSFRDALFTRALVVVTEVGSPIPLPSINPGAPTMAQSARGMRKARFGAIGLAAAGLVAGGSLLFPQKTTTPLSPVSTPTLFRSILISEFTRPALLKPSLWFLDLSRSSGTVFLLRPFVRFTFYEQFCGGASASAVRGTIQELRRNGMGCALGYAVEEGPGAFVGVLESIRLSSPGDFVSVKLTGFENGVEALQTGKNIDLLRSQCDEVCRMGAERNVRILIDAERSELQARINAICMELAQKYNTATRALVYNTYQMYLQSSPMMLKKHMDLAEQQNFRLGVKLVRGAYIKTEQRRLIWPTIEQTHDAYESAVECVAEAPVDVVVATHNRQSIEKAKALDKTGKFTFAQLRGISEDIGYALVKEKHKVIKYVPWGTVDECLFYLERRAVESSTSSQQASEMRSALWAELGRRVRIVN